jgi:phosphoribosylglycinamide formyltransferase 1
MNLIRIGILASGRGTSLNSLIDAINSKAIPAKIVLIISNKKDAPILGHQQKFAIKTVCIENKGKTRAQHEQLISKELHAHHVDLILLIGYMRILSKTFIEEWCRKIFNVHPSLLPDFAGMMDIEVHRAVLAAKKKETGCTVHLVTEDVDQGAILVQKRCLVTVEDTLETLKAKVQRLEGEALVEAVQSFISER